MKNARSAGEVMRLALEVKDREEAKRFLSDYAQVVVDKLTKDGEDVTAQEAMEIAKNNLSLMAALEGEESFKRVQQLFETGHPRLSYYTGG
jgi:hypothetical protein